MIMRSTLFDRRLVQYPALSIFIAVAAGCQSGDTAKVLDTGDQPKPAQQKVTEAELRGFCPRVTLRDGTAYFNILPPKKKAPPVKVQTDGAKAASQSAASA